LRSDIFILGIIMVVLGPVLVAAAASSCLLTILSGNVFACANVLPVFIGGGALFVTGIITCIVGVIMPEPTLSQVQQPLRRPAKSPARNAAALTRMDYSPARSAARHQADLSLPTRGTRKRNDLRTTHYYRGGSGSGTKSAPCDKHENTGSART
jgi:hypothetical protein